MKSLILVFLFVKYTMISPTEAKAIEPSWVSGSEVEAKKDSCFKGNGGECNNLGVIYEKGIGDNKSMSEAAKFYAKRISNIKAHFLLSYNGRK
ncbi:MAG: sel1 repeat family protein [Chlamydiae bacterium]|nr:sel1 repeat family protein [Chlamydiota bacterium]